jgi:mono/diheme cytochrome c family protein
MLYSRIVTVILAATALLAAIGCSKQSAAVDQPRQKPSRLVSFKEVQAVFSSRCIACHAPGAYEDGTPMGGMTLSAGKSAAQLIGFKSIESPLNRVEPYSLEKSYIHHKLHGTFASVGGSGVKMPLGSTIPDAEIAVIDDWILSGAPTD